MALLNDNYLKLKAGYLFPEIGRRVKAFLDAHPDSVSRLIRCGIGDAGERAGCRPSHGLRRSGQVVASRKSSPLEGRRPSVRSEK